MNIAFFIAHPSQYYLFRESIKHLSENNNIYLIYFEKDVIPDLIKGDSLSVKKFKIKKTKRLNKFNFLISFIKKEIELYKILKENSIDVILGSSIAIAHVAKMIGAKSIIFTEDDINVISISAKIGYPFVDNIISPIVCDLGKWEKKSIKYPGYQKLAYLHPKIFEPNYEIASKYIGKDINNFFLIRFSNLTAHHDIGIRGLSDEIASRLIEYLSRYGRLFISSEKKLEEKFENYRLKVDPIDIHHILSFSKLLISDSQSMSVEAAMLGVPSIRISDFAGKISVLEELEHKYNLTFGIKPRNTQMVFNIIEDIMSAADNLFKQRCKIMLNDKINVSQFIIWLISNYPDSVELIRKEIKIYEKFK
ncbi:MAG: DUF354 domain-containing protein [Candidatus Lokiarchaeota archaeon]|nr:DUF354 domain-containing protein [Candidatus Lokiarchaeota archaeon]